MKPRKIRVVPSEWAGYGPGRHQAQYRDPVTGIWADYGDPVDTYTEAIAKATEARTAWITEEPHHG